MLEDAEGDPAGADQFFGNGVSAGCDAFGDPRKMPFRRIQPDKPYCHVMTRAGLREQTRDAASAQRRLDSEVAAFDNGLLQAIAARTPGERIGLGGGQSFSVQLAGDLVAVEIIQTCGAQSGTLPPSSCRRR